MTGGPARFTRNFRGSVLLGVTSTEPSSYVYGGITLYAGLSQVASTSTMVSHSALVRQNQQNGPTTPHTQRLPAVTRARFSLIRFRSPLLSESLLFSLPVGTEMFHFPTFPPTPYVFRCR